MSPWQRLDLRQLAKHLLILIPSYLQATIITLGSKSGVPVSIVTEKEVEHTGRAD